MGESYLLRCECGQFTHRTLDEWLELKDPKCACGKSLVDQRRELFVGVSAQPKSADEN